LMSRVDFLKLNNLAFCYLIAQSDEMLPKSPVDTISFRSRNYIPHVEGFSSYGWTDDGLPIGLQIVGRRFDDVTVLKAAVAFEQASPWADK